MDPARQVDRDDDRPVGPGEGRQQSGDELACATAQRRIGARSGAENAVDQHGCPSREPHDLVGFDVVDDANARLLRCSARIGMQPLAGRHHVDSRAITGQLGGGEQGVAAVVAAPGEHEHRRRRARAAGELLAHDGGECRRGHAHEGLAALEVGLLGSAHLGGGVPGDHHVRRSSSIDCRSG